MISRIKLIFLSFGMAVMGVLSVIDVLPMLPFVLLSSVFYTLIGIGGFLHNTRQEIQDMRDIYLEREKMLKEKLESMQEEIISKEKENILLLEKTASSKNKKQLDITDIML